MNSTNNKKFHLVTVHLTIFVMVATMFASVPVIKHDYAHGISKVCRTTANLYVRSKAKLSSSKLGKLKKGSYVVVKGSTKVKGVTWYKVKYKSKTGYLSSKYAKTLTVKVSGVRSLQGKVTVSSGNVVLRDGPGTMYPSVGKLAKGKTFKITGKAKDVYGKYWYQFKSNGGYCYITSKYVKTSSANSSNSSSSSGSSSSSSSSASSSSADSSYDVTSVNGLVGKVNTSSNALCVRKGPDKSCKKVGTLAKNKTFNITGKATNQDTIWYRLNYNDEHGYVCGQYVSVTNTSSSSNSSTTEAGDTNNPKTLKARQAAVDWAIDIANDNSFHYGETKWAHHNGCYFCGTNQASGSLKRKAGASLAECEKTYCCNPFVTAAYNHGAGAKEADCKVSSLRVGLANDPNKIFNNTDAWLRVSKPSDSSELKVGDILLTPTHAMIYAGNNKIVHAKGHDDGKKNSKMWNDSILLGKLTDYQWNRTSKIYRYLGTGKF